ncbi:MAG: DUF2796 domain-containing protein [Rhodobacter sp.]|nr:DUF2796 domain-containing protein [Rhodobacter sp.]
MSLKPIAFFSTALALALPAYGEETRELDAHEHGHGALNIAIEGNRIAIELEVPGFDIVGFEYEAESDEDKAAVEAALATLGDPLNLFAVPAAAGCEVTEAVAELHGDEEHHDEHGEDHAEGEEHHDEHAEGEEHAHGEEHSEGEEHHDEHGDGESHSEFHAEYLMTCSDIGKATSIELSYFRAFENAEELEVQLVTEKGAALMEATPEAAILDLTQAM